MCLNRQRNSEYIRLVDVVEIRNKYGARRTPFSLPTGHDWDPGPGILVGVINDVPSPNRQTPARFQRRGSGGLDDRHAGQGRGPKVFGSR